MTLIQRILKNPKLLFKFLCHGRRERCYSFAGEPLVVCSRCMAIYISFFITSIILFLLYGFFTATISLILALLFLVPIAIDGITQVLELRESTNALRFITGYIAGIGISFLFYASYTITLYPERVAVKLPTPESLVSIIPLFPLLFILKHADAQSKNTGKLFNLLILISLAFLGVAVLYLWGYMLLQSLALYR